MSIVIINGSKPKRIYKSKLTTDKKVETFSLVVMLMLFLVQAAYGTTALGILAKKLITWLIIGNVGFTTYRSVKSAIKAAQTIQKA